MFENAFESVRSLIVGHPEKSVSGEVLQVKNTNHNGEEETKYVSSTIADFALNKPKKEIEIDYESEKSINDRIDYVAYKTRYSSKLVNTDEITGKEYDENCPELLLHEIPGSQMIYYPPAGVVYCHDSNLIVFKCVCIHFMIMHKIIPYQLTCLNKNQIYKLKRSTGFFQRGYLEYNSGIRISKTTNKLILNIGFNSDGNQIISENQPFEEGIIVDQIPILSYSKHVVLDDFCSDNNISKVSIDYHKFKFSEEIIDSERQKRPALAKVMTTYNNKLEEYLLTFQDYEILEIIC